MMRRDARRVAEEAAREGNLNGRRLRRGSDASHPGFREYPSSSSCGSVQQSKRTGPCSGGSHGNNLRVSSPARPASSTSAPGSPARGSNDRAQTPPRTALDGGPHPRVRSLLGTLQRRRRNPPDPFQQGMGRRVVFDDQFVSPPSSVGGFQARFTTAVNVDGLAEPVRRRAGHG